MLPFRSKNTPPGCSANSTRASGTFRNGCDGSVKFRPPNTSARFCAQAADGDQVAPFFGFMGAMSALVFSCMGAAYGTAKSGVGIASMGVMRPELVMKSIVPVVMAGVLGIYGLIVAVILQGSISKPEEANGAFTTKFSSFSGYAYLSAGLCCGLSGLAAGMAIGVVGDAGVRAVGQQEKLFVGMILILIFAEALGLYGLIVALILSQQSAECTA